ncbi:MAG TPA: Gldg family protein [Candidatus Cybelea sp.]|nr:Gldg family protein [Candidatus Cybelea sp.]
MNRRLISVAAVVLAAVLFVAVNVASDQGLRHARLDLTQDRLFTLSDGSRHVLKGLGEPIQLRFFFSEKLAAQAPQLKTYGARVRELLEEYASLSGGKIHLEVIDPEPYSDAEDRATQDGLQGVPVDQGSGELFYFGLVGTNSTDKQETIPVFDPNKEQFLEYDLTKLIYNLSDPKKPVLGVITDLPMEYGPGGMMAAMRGQSQPYALLTQLRQVFDVKMLHSDLTAIDKDVTVLLIAHPKKLTKYAEYAVDQFVLKGGHVMAFVDPFAELDAGQPGPMGMPDPGEVRSSSLPELFKAWGIEMTPDKFVGDRKLAIQVQMGGGARRQVQDYVAWLAVGRDNLSKSDVVTSDLGTLDLGTAGSLTQVKDAATKFEPLLWSSDQAGLLDADLVRYAPNPDKIFTALKPTGERYVLAARITGKVNTAFPDGPPPMPEKKKDADAAADKPDAKAEPPAPQIKESAEPINVIVVADTDMLDDRFWVRTESYFGRQVAVPISANADFVVNGIDNLSGSNDLIGLRSRGRSYRPFLVVDNLRHDAEQKFLAQQQSLQKKLDDTQKQIADLQSKAKASGGGALFSAEEQSTVENFRQEILRTRKELRDVQHSLNRDIERLAGELKFINIALVPLAVAILALALAGVRYQRRKARAARHE